MSRLYRFSLRASSRKRKTKKLVRPWNYTPTRLEYVLRRYLFVLVCMLDDCENEDPLETLDADCQSRTRPRQYPRVSPCTPTRER